MEIPEPFNRIIKKNYAVSALSNTRELTNFFNSCFRELITELKILPKDYQARAIKTGDMFEYAFWYLVRHKFDLDITDKVSLPKACMCSGGELDFGIFKKDEPHIEKNLLCGIEAKGSDPNSSDRAGLKRTDTIKKGISNAYQFKRIYPKLPFFIVTNVKPTDGNAKCMMSLAEGDIVDKFVDVTNIDDLNLFVNTIKKFH